MTRTFAVFLPPLCAAALVCGQENNPGTNLPKAKAGTAYPVKIHISEVQVRPRCTTSLNSPLRGTYCEDAIYARATVDGKKTELIGFEIWASDEPIPLLPGDYEARMLKAPQPAGPQRLGQKYELVMPDRTLWQCTVTGIWE